MKNKGRREGIFEATRRLFRKNMEAQEIKKRKGKLPDFMIKKERRKK